MRHLTIALMLPSQIHFLGVTSILRAMTEANCNVVTIDGENLREEIVRLHPSIIIADALCVDGEWEEVKAAYGSSLKIIGLVHSQLPPQKLKWMDDTFSIYDGQDSIIQTVRKNMAADDEDDKGKEISPREKDVIVGIVKGLSNKEIASAMNVSVNTVMTHRRNIASKLHIHTPAGLTIYAIVSNLVKLEDIKAEFELGK